MGRCKATSTPAGSGWPCHPGEQQLGGFWGRVGRATRSAGLARPPGGSASAALERAFPCSAEATWVGGDAPGAQCTPIPGRGADSRPGALPVRGGAVPVRGGAFPVFPSTLPSIWGSLLLLPGALPTRWGALLLLRGTFPVLPGALPAPIEGAGTRRCIVSGAVEESSPRRRTRPGCGAARQAPDHLVKAKENRRVCVCMW